GEHGSQCATSHRYLLSVEVGCFARQELSCEAPVLESAIRCRTEATWLIPGSGNHSCGTAPDSHRLRSDTAAPQYRLGEPEGSRPASVGFSATPARCATTRQSRAMACETGERSGKSPVHGLGAGLDEVLVSATEWPGSEEAVLRRQRARVRGRDAGDPVQKRL